MHWIVLMVAAVCLLAGVSARGADLLVYFGTKDSGPTRGFYVSQFDSETGLLTVPKMEVRADAPAYFILSSNGKHLYTCNGIPAFEGRAHMGAVSAYAIEPKTGHLTLLNQKPAGGEDPCYLVLDKTGRYLLVSNYQGNRTPGEGGTIAVLAVNPDGSLGAQTAGIQHKGTSIDPVRQKQAYAHSVIVDPTNRFAIVCDLGVDKVFIYRFNKKEGTLVPNDPPFAAVRPGSGPRHCVFSPSGKNLYVLLEMGNAITACRWDAAKGSLSPFQEISTLPADFTGVSTCAEIMMTPDGKFLYASNRGHDSIAEFAVDAASGKLSLIGIVPSGGNIPRNFDFDPTHQWLLVTNHGSDNAVVFKVDRTTGRLTRPGDPVPVTLPFCPRFLRLPATP